MTGKYGFRARWYHNDLKDASTPLSDNHLIFSQMLKQRGYATALCGKWQLPGTYAEYGFDEHCMWEANGKKPFPGFDGPIEHWTDATRRPPGGFLENRAARYGHPQISRNGKFVKTTKDDYGPDLFVDSLLDFAKRKRDQPFFIYYPMALTHASWDFDRNVSGYLPTPKLDANGYRTPGKSAPGLKANVEYMDYLMGRIVRELTVLGLRDNTILFITGDNGTGGYGKGKVEQEKGPRAPLVVYGPGHVKPLGDCDALINHCDLFATLRELSGASLPEGYVIDGHSFAPPLAAKRRFEDLLATLSPPDPNDPIVQACLAKAGEADGSAKAIVPDQTTLTVGADSVAIRCRHFVSRETDATVSLSRDGNSLLVKFDVQNQDAGSLKQKPTKWGECDGVELSLYGAGVGNLILRVYPDGTTESHKNTQGDLQPKELAPGLVTVRTSLTPTGWAAHLRLTPALFGGALPKSLKLNAGGNRPGWFAWINQGRENFRPKNQGVAELR